MSVSLTPDKEFLIFLYEEVDKQLIVSPSLQNSQNVSSEINILENLSFVLMFPDRGFLLTMQDWGFCNALLVKAIYAKTFTSLQSNISTRRLIFQIIIQN